MWPFFSFVSVVSDLCGFNDRAQHVSLLDINLSSLSFGLQSLSKFLTSLLNDTLPI